MISFGIAMPISIKKSGLSNKTQTLPERTPAKPHHALGHPKHSQGYSPFIDRLTIVIDPPNDEDAHHIHQNIWTQIQDTSVFQDAGSQAKMGYKLAKRIALEGLQDKYRALLQYTYTGHLAVRLRLDFTPVDLGPSGLLKLHAVLVSILDGGWGYVIAHGRISRLDVTVDIPDVRPDEFLFLPQQGTTMREWKTDGHLETMTFGRPQGSQTLVYNRKAKRLAKDQYWAGKAMTRVERRLRSPPIKALSELPKMANPFAALKMVHNIPGPPTGVDPDTWSMFQDSVSVRNLGPALQLLKKTQRTIFRKHLAAHPQLWWDPDSIWDNWITMLNDLKIASASAWK